MADKGNDGGDGTVLGHRFRSKDADPGIPGKITAAAQAVHHSSPVDVGGIHISIQIYFDGGVQGNHAQAPDYFRMVGDFVGTDQDLVMVLLDRFIESFPVFICFLLFSEEFLPVPCLSFPHLPYCHAVFLLHRNRLFHYNKAL